MGSGSSSRSTSNVPWGPQGVEFERLYTQARGVGGQELNYYPDSTIAQRDPLQQRSSALVSRLAGGDELVGAARQNTMETLRGDYLTPEGNPYLRDVFRTGAEDVSRSYLRTVMPNLESRFAGSGRGELVTDPTQAPRATAASAARSSAQGELADSLSQLSYQLYGGNFGAERGRQQIAAGQVTPSVRGQEYRDAAELRAAGADDFSYAQTQLNDLIARFNFAQDEPYMRAQRYQDLISQPVGYGGGSSRVSGSGGSAQTAGLITGGVGATASLLGVLLPLLACHCAAEYYGWYTPKWYAAREFILNGGLGQRFLEFYREHSEELAEVIRKHPKVKQYLKPIFEFAANGGE